MQYDASVLTAERNLFHSSRHKQWGTYGKYRSNNDLLSYDLTLKVDPKSEHIKGNNKIRFKMLKDDNKIRIDLYLNWNGLVDHPPKSYHSERKAFGFEIIYIKFQEIISKPLA